MKCQIKICLQLRWSKSSILYSKYIANNAVITCFKRGLHACSVHEII